MKSILQFILKLLARATIARYRPRVVGVTGSVGKTSTKEAVACVLASRFTVGQNSKNYNNEIGLPLAIIGAQESGGRNPARWFEIFVRALWQLAVKQPHYPELLVLEMGVDHRGDMDYLLSVVQPEVGVLTAVSAVHLEFLGGVEAVFVEKAKLLRSLPRTGLAVASYEDERIRSLFGKLRTPLMAFGFSDQAQVWADAVQLSRDEAGEVRGLSCKLHYGGSATPLLLPGVIGRHQINVALAAAAVGLGLGLTAVDVSAALRDFVFPPGRMRLLAGVRGSYLIDDSYNSSPLALAEALKTLADFPLEAERRRWAVLGDMLELGAESETLHRQAGELVASLGLTYLVTVGERSRDIGRGAGAVGFPPDRYVHFARAREAGEYVMAKLRQGDAVLVKGSQGVRLERTVKMLMAEPARAHELLVRQSPPWV